MTNTGTVCEEAFEKLRRAHGVIIFQLPIIFFWNFLGFNPKIPMHTRMPNRRFQMFSNGASGRHSNRKRSDIFYLDTSGILTPNEPQRELSNGKG